MPVDINYREAVDGCLDVIHSLKEKEKVFYSVWELREEIRSYLKYGHLSIPGALEGESTDECIYRRLCECIGDTQ